MDPQELWNIVEQMKGSVKGISIDLNENGSAIVNVQMRNGKNSSVLYERGDKELFHKIGAQVASLFF